jgi:hypothetical protein
MSAMDPKMVDPSHNRQSDDIRAANLRRESPTTQTTISVSGKRKNIDRNQAVQKGFKDNTHTSATRKNGKDTSTL